MKAAPYGSWTSAISAEQLAAATVRFGQIGVAGDTVFCSEGRPGEGGRNVVVECDAAGSAADVNPAPFNARTRVHEYGGGDFIVAPDGEVFFSHDGDGRIYRTRRGATPQPVTKGGALRYADFALDPARDRLIAVREDHSAAGEAVNTIVAIALGSGAESVLARGHDFFSNPRLSPDGRQLAWLSWDHPRMPWQGSDLWVAVLDAEGGLAAPRHVAGGDRESIFQPEWSPAGELHFASDRSGWWNLQRERTGRIEPLHAMAAEFGEPQWNFAFSMYGFEADGRIVCLYEQGGRSHLARLDPASGAFAEVETPYCSLRELHVGAGFVACFAASEREAEALVRFDLARGSFSVLRRSSETAYDPGELSIAEAIEFPTEGGLTAHAFFYAPRNAAFVGEPGTKPPLLVISHGGPTGATSASLGPRLQYWTQRGFAVVDVNYGGSSGYGRAYRERLDGRWGVVDVDDVVNAARFLVARGDVDPERLAIRGASAGGFTTLAALAFRDVFHAGASHYGIGDLEALARDTHKFESRYLDSLVGPYPARADLYRERSPVNFTERLSSALILFQGAEDLAVPPNQAEAMFAAVRAKGLPVAYLLFPGEQHGFRQARHIRRALEAELAFYGRIFGFVPADAIEPVEIENLPPR
ncbi:MAG: prolyl oligopeptidase family serine peptidase [Burkholderiales bacterium]|nr:prolyl oligopeptidase family serine peptidase [Burkholderiales bacterium]